LGFTSFEEARYARNAANKQIITVGIGDAVANDVSIRKNLDELGNLLFMLVPNPQEVVEIEYVENNAGKVIEEIPITLLERTLSTVQKRLEDFADSFYWIEYKSPLVGNITAPTDYTLSISIANNDNQDPDGVFEAPFSKEDFFTGESGVYINSSASDPAGIEVGETLVFGFYNEVWDNLVLRSASQTLIAQTIIDGYWNAKPEYSWAVGASQVIDLEVKNISSFATVKVADENRQEIESQILVEDLDNGFFTGVNVRTEDLILPYPIMTSYYPFNGNANDESGNGYHGTVYGPTLTADRFGNVRKAYLFGGDSAQDYIAIRDLHYKALSSIDEITVCAWVQTTSDKVQRIISFDAVKYWALHMNEGKLRWSVATSDWDGNWSHPAKVEKLTMGTRTINDGQWHFVCATFKKSFDIDSKLYLDGILVDSENASSNMPIGNTFFTRYGFIGTESIASEYNGNQENSGFPYFFDGKIDEVMIIEKALTPGQIQYLYSVAIP